MVFDYYYGTQADQFTFIKIPKLLITDEMFDDLSLPAKVLYGILLDRMSLSMKNRWFDSENRVYIIYQISDIQEDLRVSKNKAIELLRSLEKFGLVEKKRRGLGMPSLLYVKSFLINKDSQTENLRSPETETSVSANIGDEKVRNYGDLSTDESNLHEFRVQKLENGNSRSFEIGTSRSVENETSRGLNLGLQEVSETGPQSNTNINYNNINNTNVSNTYVSDIKSNPILSGQNDGMRKDESNQTYQLYEELIKENVDYDCLLQNYPLEADKIKGIVELIIDTVMASGEQMVIASNTYPTEVVRARFLKLNYNHIEYVLDCMDRNTTKVKNIKKYILATLYNAPATMSSYYTAEVNHDMPQFARGGGMS